MKNRIAQARFTQEDGRNYSVNGWRDRARETRATRREEKKRVVDEEERA